MTHDLIPVTRHHGLTLLSLNQHKSTRIISPAAMIELLEEAESAEQRQPKS